MPYKNDIKELKNALCTASCNDYLPCLCRSKRALSYPIHTLHSWTQAVSLFEEQLPETLVILDVDRTLIVPDLTDMFAQGRSGWPSWLKDHIIATHPQLAIDANWELFYSIVWQHAPRHLIEKEVIDAIAVAHQHECHVIALTAVESGAYGLIPSMPLWRHEMLSSLGFFFSTVFPDVVLDQLPAHRATHPVLYKGILYCNSRPKGEILKEFLRLTSYAPPHIVFIDDDEANLHSVADTCIQLNIPCSLYHYDNPTMVMPLLDLDDFMHKVQHVLNHSEYPARLHA